MTDLYLLGYPVTSTSPVIGLKTPLTRPYLYTSGTQLAGLRVKGSMAPAGGIAAVQGLWYGISSDGAPLEGPWLSVLKSPPSNSYSEVLVPRSSTLISIEVLGLKRATTPCCRTGSGVVQGFRLNWLDADGKEQQGQCSAGGTGEVSLGSCATPDVPLGFTFYLSGDFCSGVDVVQGPLPASVEYSGVQGPSAVVPAPVTTSYAFSEEASSAISVPLTLSATMTSLQSLSFSDSLLQSLSVPISQPSSLGITPTFSNSSFLTSWRIPASLPAGLLTSTSEAATSSSSLIFGRTVTPTAGQQLQLVVQQTSIAPSVAIQAIGMASYSWNSENGPVQLPPREVQLSYVFSGTLSVSTIVEDVAASARSILVNLPP